MKQWQLVMKEEVAGTYMEGMKNGRKEGMSDEQR